MNRYQSELTAGIDRDNNVSYLFSNPITGTDRLGRRQTGIGCGGIIDERPTMTPLAKALFIFTSYGPLWLLMGVRFGVVEPTAKLASWAPGLSIGFYVAAGASVFVFLGLLKICQKSNPVEIEIEGYARKDDHILAYVVTYFPPLFSLNLGTPADLWSLVVIYATVAIVYIRLDAYYINPFFALAGYRVFEITTEGGKKTYAALIKRKVVLKKGAMISGPLWDDIFISEGEQ